MEGVAGDGNCLFRLLAVLLQNKVHVSQYHICTVLCGLLHTVHKMNALRRSCFISKTIKRILITFCTVRLLGKLWSKFVLLFVLLLFSPPIYVKIKSNLTAFRKNDLSYKALISLNKI